jgi:hypothetical protein
MERTKFIDLNNKLDIHLGLEVEQLSCLLKIEKYYLGLDNVTKEKITTELMTAERLSKTKDFRMPLLVGGKMIGEGRPLKRYYTAEELKKSTFNPINSSFPILYDHKTNPQGYVLKVEGIIGKVDRIYYDASIKTIRWEGHINDETMARNVWDNLISEVSATILSYKGYSEKYGEVGLDLTYTELSLCGEGLYHGTSIEVR